MPRRVIITGMGVLSPIGNSVTEFDLGLRNAKNGIGPITHFDTTDFNVHIAGKKSQCCWTHQFPQHILKIARYVAIPYRLQHNLMKATWQVLRPQVLSSELCRLFSMLCLLDI